MFTYLVQTVNNMYQNVSGKSIENQELILRAFFCCDNLVATGKRKRSFYQCSEFAAQLFSVFSIDTDK